MVRNAKPIGANCQCGFSNESVGDFWWYHFDDNGFVGVGQMVLLAGIIMFGLGTLFSFITLPVEYDASNRALAWLKSNGIVTPDEYNNAEDSLKWAARTYVVAAIGSLATLLYFIMIYLGRD